MDARQAEAVRLRQEGRTRREIAEALGVHDGKQLTQWLRGVMPNAGRHPNARSPELRARAVELRSTGATYREIVEVIGVAPSTVSLWCRDVPLSGEQLARWQSTAADGRARRAAGVSASWAVRRAAVREAARVEAADRCKDPLFVGGLVAYWAEGRKSKPWRRNGRVVMTNSEDRMITLFLRWLEAVGFDRSTWSLRVAIHETADVEAAQRHWADLAGVDVAAFQRVTLKTHRPTTNRLNRFAEYHGCLVVTVQRSTMLYEQIEGWWAGYIEAVASC